MQLNQEKRRRRHRRVRAKISGRADKPRLCVFRSAKHIYAQLINDEKGCTLAVASSRELKEKKREGKIKSEEQKTGKEKTIGTGKIAIAYGVGKLIAEKAKKLKIEQAVFDRGGYKYHGRVKALEEGAREGGLKFRK